MKFLRHTFLIIEKDLRVEFRNKETIISMLLFVMLMVIIFSIAFFLDRQTIGKIAPGILWVAFAFTGTLGFNRTFARERIDGGMKGLLLSPIPRSAIYAGKMIVNFLFLAVVEIITIPVLALLFDIPLLENPGLIALVTLLGTLGFVSVGTLLSAMLVNTRLRDVLLPVVLYPIVIPVIIAAVQGTRAVLIGADDELFRSIQILIGFDVIFLSLALWVFDYVVEE